MSLLQWHSILNTPSFLLHTSTTVQNLCCWKYELWPESAISCEQWGIACEVWLDSAIMSAGVWHSCIGLRRNTKHQCEWLEEGGGEHFSNNSQGLKWWILHTCISFICIDFIQFLTSFSASAAASTSATSAASAQTTVQTV